MTKRRISQRSGFSLVELAIVMGVFAIIIGALWTLVAYARQNQRLEQVTEQTLSLVDAVRTTYAASPNISGNVYTVLPNLASMGAVPGGLQLSQATACGAVTAYYMNTPWGSGSIYDGCGTLRICAWPFTTNVNTLIAPASNTYICNTPANTAAATRFAVEFTQLDYPGCIDVATHLSPLAISGMTDIVINGYSGLLTTGELPPPAAMAQSLAPYAGDGCMIGSTGNVVDFVFTLRPPST